MARPWSRKRDEETPRGAVTSEPVESVHLDDDDHAWWAKTELGKAWTPRGREHTDTKREQRDILAEHFGEDWRTSFLYTRPSEEQQEAERQSEQQTLDDQDPYKVLQVPEDATWDQIVTAHRHQARLHHPDGGFGRTEGERAAAEERIRIINLAYQELRVRRGM